MIDGTASRRKIGVFHPGTQHSWQTSRALQELDDLSWYATSIFHIPNRLPYSLVPFLPSRVREIAQGELRRFEYPKLDASLVHLFGANQWAMRICARLGWRHWADQIRFRDNVAFAKPVGRLLRNNPVRAVWGYDLSSLEVFEAAQGLGSKTILDQTIGHPRAYNAIMEDVYLAYPEFFPSSDYKLPHALIDRVDREHELADIVTVGSEFCRSTFVASKQATSTEQKVRVVEYCYEDTFFVTHFRPEKCRHPIRFLFLGQAGPRKGVHLLLKVFEKIPRSAASLTIVGDLVIPIDTFRQYSERLTYKRTVPRADVPVVMRDADCLIFPTYFEGAALVLYEALASGLGIIQSKNTGIVADRGVGLLMEELTEDELYRCVMTVVDNPALIDTWRAKATEVSTNYTFEAYKSRVRKVASDV
jgi:glycosyltransferase involved in cell wall biosynthesis